MAPVCCSMSSSNCCFLTYIQISQVSSHFFQNFPHCVVIYTVKGISVVNEADAFFWNSIAFSMIQWILAIWSLMSLPIWLVHVEVLGNVLLKPRLKYFEHYLPSMWDEHNCTVVWTFFGIDFLWYWNENWPFPILWPLLSFPNLLAYSVHHFNSIIC